MKLLFILTTLLQGAVFYLVFKSSLVPERETLGQDILNIFGLLCSLLILYLVYRHEIVTGPITNTFKSQFRFNVLVQSWFILLFWIVFMYVLQSAYKISFIQPQNY